MTSSLAKTFMVLVLVAAVGATAATSWFAQAKGSAEDKTTPASSVDCKKDADCTLVPDDCCGCNEGGGQRALSKQRKDSHEKQRLKRCAGTMCAQMISQHPSCGQRAVCAAGICKLG